MIKIMLFSIGVIFMASSVEAQELSIAAVVNNKVISTIDLDERLRLNVQSGSIPDDPKMRRSLRGKILQSLIDEQLKLDEAERFSLLVAPNEIDDAIARIEKSSNRPAGSLLAELREQSISIDSLKQQIASQIAWQKLLGRQVRREIAVTDEEVRRTQKRLARGQKVEEVQIASIIFPIGADSKIDEVKRIADKVRQELADGEAVEAVLNRYKEQTRIEISPLSWVPLRRLNPMMMQAISSLQNGEMTSPLPTPIGLQLIRLMDRRQVQTMPDQNAEVALKQIVLKLNERSMNEEIDAKMAIARSVAKYPGSCTQKGIAGMKEFDGLNIEVNYIRTTLVNMSPEVRRLVEPLPMASITEPFAAPDGIHMLMLCEKIIIPAPLPEAEQVRQQLFAEKMQLEEEKYLRRLRREAFVDIRI